VYLLHHTYVIQVFSFRDTDGIFRCCTLVVIRHHKNCSVSYHHIDVTEHKQAISSLIRFRSNKDSIRSMENSILVKQNGQSLSVIRNTGSDDGILTAITDTKIKCKLAYFT